MVQVYLRSHFLSKRPDFRPSDPPLVSTRKTKFRAAAGRSGAGGEATKTKDSLMASVSRECRTAPSADVAPRWGWGRFWIATHPSRLTAFAAAPSGWVANSNLMAQVFDFEHLFLAPLSCARSRAYEAQKRLNPGSREVGQWRQERRTRQKRGRIRA